jgi:hypothetical protein
VQLNPCRSLLVPIQFASCRDLASVITWPYAFCYHALTEPNRIDTITVLEGIVETCTPDPHRLLVRLRTEREN